MMSLAIDCGTSSYRSNCIVKVARPCVIERRSVAYPNISASGTFDLIDCALPLGSSASTRQRRLRALHRLLERHRAGDLERHLARVDLVVRPLDELDPDVDDRIPREDPGLHRLLDAEIDRRDVLLRDLPADDL